MLNTIYEICKTTGGVFYLGAFEGFIIYASAIVLGYLIVFDSNGSKAKRIKMAKR